MSPLLPILNAALARRERTVRLIRCSGDDFGEHGLCLAEEGEADALSKLDCLTNPFERLAAP